MFAKIKTDKSAAKPLIEKYTRNIAEKEGPATHIEVMVELNVNTEAMKSVVKVQGRWNQQVCCVNTVLQIIVNTESASSCSCLPCVCIRNLQDLENHHQIKSMTPEMSAIHAGHMYAY